MYTLAVSKDFIANHYLIGGDWGNENFPHSHHYVVELIIEGSQLDQHGYLLDIVDVELKLEQIVVYFRDQLLNDKAEFYGLNPSIEHFSRIIAEKLLLNLSIPSLSKLTVKLWETDTIWASYTHNN